MKRRTIHNSLAWNFQNWTLDNVGELVDSYAGQFREALNDYETEFRPLTGEEINTLFRKAQLDVNMLRRLTCMAQSCIDLMKARLVTLEKARELSGEMVAWEDDKEEDQADEDDSPST